jgi:hypothetical protein
MNRSFIFDQFVFFPGTIILLLATPFFSTCCVFWSVVALTDEDALPASSAAYVIPAAKTTRKRNLCTLPICCVPLDHYTINITP